MSSPFKDVLNNGSPGPVTRRRFVTATIGTGGALAIGVRAEDDDPHAALRAELEARLAACGYDPSAGDCALVAIMSDPHIFLGNDYPGLITAHWDDDLIAELNALHPPITHLVLAGDLISHRSMTPGSPRYPLHEQWSIDEYALAHNELQRFRMPIWAVPGNHDTDAYETDAEMFQEKTGFPPYQRIELAGVPVLLLNTGNGGMLNGSQETWLRAQAETIPGDQEVLIVQHVPTFSCIFTQAGSKRIIAEAFSHRSAPVYIASGHNHRFDEGLSEFKGTCFVQMATTTANRVVFNDKKNPGYLLVAVQDGQVRARIQRSLTVSVFWPRPPLAALPVASVRFPFDGVEYLLDAFEEGFYNTRDYLEFFGVHVGCYIAYCKRAVLRIAPPRFHGAIRRLYVSGLITASSQPACWISRNGSDGPWEELTFPPASGSGLYLIELPGDVATLEQFHVKIDTGLTGNVQGFSWSGWALASDSSSVTGYEVWLHGIYGTLVRSPESAPDAIARGGSHPNLLTYACNLPPCGRGPVSGLPSITMPHAHGTAGNRASILFTRSRDPVADGLEYLLERSFDMTEWFPLDSSAVTETVIEECECYERIQADVVLADGLAAAFFRVRVVHVSRGFGD